MKLHYFSAFFLLFLHYFSAKFILYVSGQKKCLVFRSLIRKFAPSQVLAELLPSVL